LADFKWSLSKKNYILFKLKWASPVLKYFDLFFSILFNLKLQLKDRKNCAYVSTKRERTNGRAEARHFPPHKICGIIFWKSSRIGIWIQPETSAINSTKDGLKYALLHWPMQQRASFLVPSALKRMLFPVLLLSKVLPRFEMRPKKCFV